MPLVPALCTQCGSKLEIDSSQEAAVYPYCHTPFITEKAINNYNTTNITNIGHLHADVANISDNRSREKAIEEFDQYIRSEKISLFCVRKNMVANLVSYKLNCKRQVETYEKKYSLYTS